MPPPPPSPATLAAYIRERLTNWPIDAPLPRGVFEMDVDGALLEWLFDIPLKEKYDLLWRMVLTNEVSAWGLTDCLAMLYQEVGRFVIKDTFHRLEISKGVLSAGLTWRHDLEVRGRRYVADKGFDFYFGDVSHSGEISAHELLELRFAWRDAGCEDGYDAEFVQCFPRTLAEHQAWLSDHTTGRRASLCGRDLREVSFGPEDLRGADLRAVILRNLNLDGFDLRECDLRYADLGVASLVGADLRDADLRGCDLGLANLEYTQIEGILIEEIQHCYWKPSSWRESVPQICADLKRECLDGDLSGLDLRGRDFRGLRYGSNDFYRDYTGSDLRGALFDCGTFGDDFSGADLRGASFRAANAAGSCFNGADLRGADVTGADFRRVNLDDVQIEGLIGAEFAQWDDNPPLNGNFRGFNWNNACLEGRNFNGCDLRGATFVKSLVEHCSFVEADLRGTDWSEAVSCDCDFQQADFRGSDLGSTRFLEWSDFRGVDLRGCNVPNEKFGQGDQFEGANLRGILTRNNEFWCTTHMAQAEIEKMKAEFQKSFDEIVKKFNDGSLA